MRRQATTKTRPDQAADHIRELFAVFGPVTVKRMFGGAGIYARETMFAIAIDGMIYLKADAETIPAFEREGMAPFTFVARKKSVATSYWRIPDGLYDDPEELARWSRLALAVAERAAATKKSKRKKKTSKG